MLKIEITRFIHDGPTTYFTGLSSGRAGAVTYAFPEQRRPLSQGSGPNDASAT